MQNDASHKEIRIKLQDDRKRLLIRHLDQLSKVRLFTTKYCF